MEQETSSSSKYEQKIIIVEPKISTDLYFLGTFVDRIYRLAIKHGIGPVRDKIKSIAGRKVGRSSVRVSLNHEGHYGSPFQVVKYDFSSGRYTYLERETHTSSWEEKHPKDLSPELIKKHEDTVQRKLKKLEDLLGQSS